MNTALSQAISFVKNIPQNTKDFIQTNIINPYERSQPEYQKNLKSGQIYSAVKPIYDRMTDRDVYNFNHPSTNNYVYSGLLKSNPASTQKPSPTLTPTPTSKVKVVSVAKQQPSFVQTTMPKVTPKTVSTKISPTVTTTPITTQNPQPTTVLDSYEVNTPNNLLPIIVKASETSKVPLSILSSLLAHESMTFNPKVISGELASPAGAQGVAQFMPATAKGMGIDPLDVNQAIPAAAKKLAAHKKTLGSWELALAAYNSGIGNVLDFLNGTNKTGNNPKLLKTGGIPPFAETQKYIPHIMDRAKNKTIPYQH